MGVALAGSIASSGGAVLVPGLAPPTMCIPYLKWLGGHNVNKVKIGSKVSDIQG